MQPIKKTVREISVVHIDMGENLDALDSHPDDGVRRDEPKGLCMTRDGGFARRVASLIFVMATTKNHGFKQEGFALAETVIEAKENRRDADIADTVLRHNALITGLFKPARPRQKILARLRFSIDQDVSLAHHAP